MTDVKHHFLVVVDAILFLIQVYPHKTTDTTHTTEAMSAFINFYGIPQKRDCDQRTSFMGTDFCSFLLKVGITHPPGRKWSTWTIRKVDVQNKHFSRYFRRYLSETGDIWAKLFF